MFVLPALTIKLVDSAAISIIGIISTAEHNLTLLSYLIYVVFKKCSLYVVDVAVCGCSGHLDERFLFTLDILGSLEVIYPPQRYYPIYRLLVF